MNKIEEIKKINYIFNNKIISRNTGTIIMAYNPENGDMYEFNDIGGELFSMVEKNYTIEQIFLELTEKYETTEENIFEDVEEFIKRLIDLNIMIIQE